MNCFELSLHGLGKVQGKSNLQTGGRVLSLCIVSAKIYILLINREWDHYGEISDWGLDVLSEPQRGQYIKDEVWNFPVMTERTRLVIYLLYGLFIMNLSLRSIKTNNWSADNFKKTRHLNELYTWARATVRCHWSADTFLTAFNWP